MTPALPRELLQALANAGNDIDRASDVIEEYIIHRRQKGDTLFDVSNSLLLLENQGPARTASAIHKAQYVTNVPPASDLTSASGPAHSSSASPSTLLSYMLSEPPPPVAQARQVILEYVLAREHRHRDKKPGRGGKHTMGRDAFEEIADRLAEVEDGLRGTGILSRRGASEPIPDEELSPVRQLGLALVLSLRMLLSYFSLPDLARQLLCQTPQDAERTLVQHVRRRAPGEGRYGVGRELEYIESLTLNRRPALRPAFRSARARTHLPPRALYPITLPAPSKSACIKLLGAFLHDVEQAGPAAAQSYTQQGPSSYASQSGSLRGPGKKASPKVPSAAFGSPGSPATPLFSTSSPSTSPSRRQSNLPLAPDPTPVESYSLELLSEYLTREKREYMLKNKWVKTGRDQLGRDLGDIETALCISRGVASSHAASLLPVFLLLRRTYSLPPTALPPKIVGAAYEMLPTPPEPDTVPLRGPTVSSTTAALYVNPRLDDSAALDMVEELLESEREKGINAEVSEEKTVSWLLGLVKQIEKRFPDGSYETVFEQARLLSQRPRVWPDAANSSAFPSHPLVAVHDGSQGHRRSKSYAPTSPSNDTHPETRMPSPPKSHMRSASMPMRSSSTYSSEHEVPEVPGVPTSYNQFTDVGAMAQAAEMVPPQDDDSGSDYGAEPDNGDDVDTDSDDSEFARRVAPSAGLGLANSSTTMRPKPPPKLSLNVPGPAFGTMFEPLGSAKSFASSAQTPNSATSCDGWWDIVSAGDHSPQARKTPWVDSSSDAPSPSPSNSQLGRVAEEFDDYDDRRVESSPLDTLNVAHMNVPGLPPGADAPRIGGRLDQLVTPGLASPNNAAVSSPSTITGGSPVTVGGGSSPNTTASSASPQTSGTGPSPLRSLPAATSASMSAAAAAAIAATEAKLGGVAAPSAPNPQPNGSPSPGSSTHTTPTTTPTVPHRSMFADAPPVPSMPNEYEHDYNSNGPLRSAAGVQAPSAWPSRSPEQQQQPIPQNRPQRSRTYGSLAHMNSSGVRPPPVPVNMDRPGFPDASQTPSTRRRNNSSATAQSAKSATSQTATSSASPTAAPPVAPANDPQAATFDMSDSALDFYPSEDPGGSQYKPYTPMIGNMPIAAPAAQPATKSKLGGFGRSMSLSAKNALGRKDKDAVPTVPSRAAGAGVQRANTRARVANNPERWNKNMVAALMGPPVEKK